MTIGKMHHKYLKANQQEFYLADIGFCVLCLSGKDVSN